MGRWTRRQDEVLRTYGHLGAFKCRVILRRECGVDRSIHAIQNRASRIGVSLFELQSCPVCGRTVKRLKASGMCEICNEMRHTMADSMSDKMRSVQPSAEDEAILTEARRARWRRRRENMRRKN